MKKSAILKFFFFFLKPLNGFIGEERCMVEIGNGTFSARARKWLRGWRSLFAVSNSTRRRHNFRQFTT